MNIGQFVHVQAKKKKKNVITKNKYAGHSLLELFTFVGESHGNHSGSVSETEGVLFGFGVILSILKAATWATWKRSRIAWLVTFAHTLTDPKAPRKNHDAIMKISKIESSVAHDTSRRSTKNLGVVLLL